MRKAGLIASLIIFPFLALNGKAQKTDTTLQVKPLNYYIDPTPVSGKLANDEFKVTFSEPILADSVPLNTKHSGLEPAQDFFNRLDTVPGGPKIRAAYNTLPLPSDTIKSVTTADGDLTIIYSNGTMDEFHTKELKEPLAWFLRTYAPANGVNKKPEQSWMATMVRDRVHPANKFKNITSGTVSVIHYEDHGLTVTKNADGSFTWSYFIQPGATSSRRQLNVNVIKN